MAGIAHIPYNKSDDVGDAIVLVFSGLRVLFLARASLMIYMFRHITSPPPPTKDNITLHGILSSVCVCRSFKGVWSKTPRPRGECMELYTKLRRSGPL